MKTVKNAATRQSGEGAGSALVVAKVAFEGPNTPDRGYTIRASYLKAPHAADALIEVMKEGQPLRRFLFPAYKIYNLQAHFSDIVDGEIEKSAKGYEMAAWDGISGAVVLMPDAAPDRAAGDCQAQSRDRRSP